MKNTTNYNLKKPEGTDLVNIEDLNSNADIIDEVMGNFNSSLETKANKTDVTTSLDLKADKTTTTSLQTQISSLSNGSPKGVYATLSALNTAFPTGNTNIYVVSADGGWYYWSVSAWVKGGTYQSTSISQKSISVDHLTYYASEGVASRNLFNKDTLTSGYLNSGFISPHASKWVSDFIEIEANTDYIITDQHYNTGGDINYFDSNKAFISQLANTNNTYFTTPSNAKYLRLTTRIEWIPTCQLEKGRTRTTYTSHYPKTLIEDKSIDVSKVAFDFPTVTLGKNLYNKDYATNGYYINYLTGKADINPLYCASDYIEVENGKSYYMRYSQQYAFYDSSKIYISGVINGNLITPPVNAKYVRVSTKLTYSDTQQIEVGSTFTTFEPYCYLIEDNYKVKTTNILDFPVEIKETINKYVPSEYVTIQSAIDSCTDKTKIYNIYIKNGTYNEVNISVKQNNINLIGENIYKTIIYSNGNTVVGDLRDKHCIDICVNSNIENITFIGENTKYVLHQDFDNSLINGSAEYSAYFKNCVFIKMTADYQVTGFGCRAGQNNYFYNCKFIYEGGDIERQGILWHNWNNQSGGCELYVENCDFINCSPFHITELGSNYTDVIYINNINCNLKTGGIFVTCNGQYYIPDGSSTPLGTSGDYTMVPYNIQINVNSNISRYEADSTRPLHKTISEGNYSSIGKNIKNIVIKKGYAISTDYSNLATGRNAISIIENGELDGIALEDISQNTNGNYVLPKKCCYVFANADSYVVNGKVKVNIDGTFSKTTNIGESVAVVLETKTLSIGGLLKVLLL